MQSTTTKYTLRNGAQAWVDRYEDGSLSVSLEHGLLEATIFDFPGKDLTGVVQDWAMDETDAKAYTSYDKGDFARAVMAKVDDYTLDGADGIMAECIFVHASVSVAMAKEQS